MKWISVKDRLPEKDGFYNVFVETDERELVYSMWYEEGEWKYDNYLIAGEPEYSMGWYLEVLKWQKLPQPPKN